jgi:hypothetical protein
MIFMTTKSPGDPIWIYCAQPFVASVLWLAGLSLVISFAHIFLDAGLAWLLWGQLGLLVLMLFVGGSTFGQRIVAVGFALIWSFLQWVAVFFWVLNESGVLNAAS